jgi:hypothetical protein
MSAKIIMRTAERPEGPWSDPEIIYRAPEPSWDKTYFCYAAKGHPELSAPDELLVSYVCNSTDFAKMAGDARIYKPRFIRLKFDPAPQVFDRAAGPSSQSSDAGILPPCRKSQT